MKRLLLTGASSEIGHAIARAAVAADWDVALCCHTAEAKTAAFAKELATVRDDAKCRAFAFDLRDSAAAESAVGDAAEFLGGLDGVVLAHGVTHQRLLAELPDDEWRSVIDTNLTGAFRVARRAAKSMVRARWGRIVFVSSISGRVGQAGQANYAASKAGLLGMAKSLARELASRNICVNVVEPGPLPTDMTATLTDDQRAQLVAAVPLGRMGELDEVAAAVEFLAGDAASYITGVALAVDGGLGM